MRAPLVLALSVTGIIAGIAAAAAADLPYPLAPRGVDNVRRAAPLVVYRYEPGVTMRAYWLPPWRHRHYYPRSNRTPRLGRKESRSRVGGQPRPAETYARFWSNAAAFPCECAPTRLRDRRPPPQRYQPFPPAPEPSNS
jgi:hypothetical protein